MYFKSIALIIVLGCFFSILPIWLQPSSSIVDWEQEISIRNTLGSEMVRFSCVIGTALALFLVFDISLDTFLQKQRNVLKQFSMLSSILLSLVLLSVIRLLYSDLSWIVLVDRVAGILQIGGSLSLVIHHSTPHIVSHQLLVLAFICYVISVIIPGFSQSILSSYIVNALRALYSSLLLFVTVRWICYMVKIDKKDSTFNDIFYSATLAGFWGFLLVFVGISLYIGGGSHLGLGALAIIIAGPTWCSASYFLYILYCIGIVVMNRRFFNYEASLLKESQALLLERERELETQKELVETQKELLETKKAFVRYISHEIRTPLNTAMMSIEVLEREIGSMRPSAFKASITDVVDELHGSCDTAVGILNELLDYDKLNTGLMTLDLKSVLVKPLVIGLVNSFRMFARGKGVTLAVTFKGFHINDPFPRCIVMVDESKLSQVFRNLLSNALKFTPAGGTVHVEVDLVAVTVPGVEPGSDVEQGQGTAGGTLAGRRPSSRRANPDQVYLAAHNHRVHPELREASSSIPSSRKTVLRVRVIDSGPGISKENQLRLFKEVIQFNPGALQGGKGTGLGLWISNKISELHGGSLSVYSEGEGHGSTFSLTLNVHEIASGDGIVDSDAADEKRNEEGRDNVHDIVSGDGHAGDEKEDKKEDDKKEDEKEDEDRERVRDSIRSDVDDVTIEDPPVGKVLVVDDSSPNRKMLCRLLEGNCSSTDTAEDGQIAVNMVSQSMKNGGEAYYAILMDFQMPNMDGPTATKAIRKLGFTGLIIGVTGNALREDVELFTTSGANGVLAKPVNLGQIKSALKPATTGSGSG